MLEHCLRWLVRLYPEAWRERYGDELRALLEDSPPRWSDLLDLSKSALAARLSEARFPMRIAAFGTAGLLIAIGICLTRPPLYFTAATIEADGYTREMALSRTELYGLIRRYQLYPDEVHRRPAAEVAAQMRHDLRIDASTGTMRFTYPDREKATAVVRDLCAAMRGHEIANGREPFWRRFELALLINCLAAGLAMGILSRNPWRRAVRRAAFGALGFVIVAALSFLYPNSYTSTAVVSGVLPQVPATIGVSRLSDGVYEVSGTDRDPLQAQRLVESEIWNMASIKGIDPPTYPEIPSSPNRLIPSLGGALAGVAVGMIRRRSCPTPG